MRTLKYYLEIKNELNNFGSLVTNGECTYLQFLYFLMKTLKYYLEIKNELNNFGSLVTN